MIKNISVHKIALVIFIFLIITIFYSANNGVLKIFIDDYKMSKVANKYKDKEVRVNYFKENETLFMYFVNIFENYELDFISTENYCIEEYTYDINKELIICSNKKLDKEEISQLSHSDIVKKYKELNMQDIRIHRTIDNSKYSIIFRYIGTMINGITFEYCLSNDCNTNDNIYEYRNGSTLKDRINDKWFTTYTDAPSI